MKLGLNLYRVTRATGLRVKRISDDWLEWDLELRLTLRNRNFVGTHFGGSLYAGADPQFMLAFLHILPDLVVWDKAATIRFRKPGRGTLTGAIRIPPGEPDAIRAALAESGARGRVDRTYHFTWRDRDGDVVAEIEKVLHFRTKEAR
jgi:hypothetical protein